MTEQRVDGECVLLFVDFVVVAVVPTLTIALVTLWWRIFASY